MKRGQSGLIAVFIIVAILGVSLMWFVAGPGIPQIHLGAATGLQTNIDVVVKDSNNAPVSGATVSICPSSCAKSSPAGQKITDSRGVARFSSMPVGAYQATAAKLSAFFTAKYVQPPKAFTVVLKPRPCIDSDVGAEMPGLIPGFASGPMINTNEFVEKLDYCDNDGKLIEYYCDNGFVNSLPNTGGNCAGCAYMPLKDYSANVAGVCVPERPATGCYESDNGLDILNRGYIFPATSAYGKFDACIDKNRLSEYYCDQGDASSQIVDCPNGCKNGACVAPQCTDTDGGQNYFVKGTASGITRCVDQANCMTTASATDTCGGTPSGSLNSLQEYVCDQGIFRAVVFYDCPSGCNDGACLSAPATCTDSDGKNYDTKGTLTYTNNPYGVGQEFDNCPDANTVAEGVCNSQTEYTQNHEFHNCPNGCSNGACIQSSAIAQTYAWQLIPQGYYDPATFVQSPFGTQAKFTATCVKVCGDLNRQADTKCVGWSASADSCRKTMSANQPGQLASASTTCTETDWTSIIGFDYCCCSQ